MRPDNDGENIVLPQDAMEDTAETADSPEIASPQAEQQELLSLRPEATASAAEPPPPIPGRLEILTQAIENHPEAPANYVIRGEVLLEGGDYDLAAQDFETALNLANPLAESSNWGYINQALIDRAQQGLRHCTKNFNESRREDQ